MNISQMIPLGGAGRSIGLRIAAVHIVPRRSRSAVHGVEPQRQPALRGMRGLDDQRVGRSLAPLVVSLYSVQHTSIPTYPRR